MREINNLSIHEWLRSAIPDSQQPTSPIGFLFLKLPPPPCAVLLVDKLFDPYKMDTQLKTIYKSYKMVKYAKITPKTCKTNCRMENRVLSNRMVIPSSMIFCPTQYLYKMDIPNCKQPNKGTVEWIFHKKYNII